MVVGYYALAAISVETDGMPSRQRLSRNVSAVLLARLAVDKRYMGQGLGEFLLAHALDTVVTTAAAVGVQCVVVDALDDNAAGFTASMACSRSPQRRSGSFCRQRPSWRLNRAEVPVRFAAYRIAQFAHADDPDRLCLGRACPPKGYHMALTTPINR